MTDKLSNTRYAERLDISKMLARHASEKEEKQFYQSEVTRLTRLLSIRSSIETDEGQTISADNHK